MSAPFDDDAAAESLLARLADGTLKERERGDLERRVAASPQLTALLAEQRRAVEAIRSVSVDAPDRLHTRIEAAATDRRRPLRRGFAIAVPATAAIAAAIVLAVALGGGGGSPTVAAAAALGSKAATAPAPRPLAGHRGLLDAHVDDVPYPDLGHYRPIGARSDRVDGRSTTTVYYSDGDQRVGYTIVSGAALPEPRGRVLQGANRTRVVAFVSGGRPAVTWRRLGHTCVLSDAGTPTGTLVNLASYRSGGAIPF